MTERIDIAPEGDLVLIVGAGSELCVHSLVMMIASPVFKAMLGPNFAEGQTSGSSANPKHLPLPEDEFEGMRLLCLILHGQGQHLRRAPTMEDFVQLAKAADKYQCLDSVRLSAQAWVSRMCRAIEDSEFFYALYLLDLAEEFFERTADAVSDGVSLSKNLQTESSRAIHLLGDIETKSADIQKCLESEVVSIVQDLCAFFRPERAHYRNNANGKEPSDPDSGRTLNTPRFQLELDGSVPPKCDYLRRHVSMYLEALGEKRIWPSALRAFGLRALRQSILDFKIPIDRSIQHCEQPWGPCNRDSSLDGDCIKPAFQKAITRLQKKARDVQFGMCLDCLKAGGKFDGRCRVKHEK